MLRSLLWSQSKREGPYKAKSVGESAEQVIGSFVKAPSLSLKLLTVMLLPLMKPFTIIITIIIFVSLP